MSQAAQTRTSPRRRKAAVPFAPAKLRTKADVTALQRAMTALLVRPLTRANRMQPRWIDGRPTAALAAQIAKPNERLTSFERIEIYNRSYWFRVLDSLYDDCPGLRGVLGDRRFMRLAEAYLVKYAPRSYTLRDLPDRLARFIREEPQFTQPYTALCLDLARFEWARVEVFDTASRPVITYDDLSRVNPARLRLNLQPYLQLLALDYPVDDYLVEVKKREAELMRGDASNVPTERRLGTQGRINRPRPGRAYVAVHRMDFRVYFKRLDPAAYRVLLAIRAGQPLTAALAAGIPKRPRAGEDWAAQVQSWFQNWMELGWFCRFSRAKT